MTRRILPPPYLLCVLTFGHGLSCQTREAKTPARGFQKEGGKLTEAKFKHKKNPSFVHGKSLAKARGRESSLSFSGRGKGHKILPQKGGMSCRV